MNRIDGVYPVINAKSWDIEWLESENASIRAQTASLLVYELDVILREKTWEELPIYARLWHALRGTLPRSDNG